MKNDLSKGLGGDRVSHADTGNAVRQGGAAAEQSTHSAGLDGGLLKCMRCTIRG